jgi:uncharacterized protein involved in type VI secretion and phage assembly
MNFMHQSAAGNGVVIGVVTSLDDPLALNRVQVALPHLGRILTWARLVSPMAGGRRGLVLRPEVNDEVLVIYEQGDPSRAYVLGALWSRVDRPPAGDPERTANNWRFLRSRSGHLVKLDDTPGQERIEIEDKDGRRRLVLDSSGERVELTADSGTITIEAKAGDVIVSAPAAKVTVNAQELVAEASETARIKATTITIEASADMTVQAGGVLSLKGAQVALN